MYAIVFLYGNFGGRRACKRNTAQEIYATVINQSIYSSATPYSVSVD